MKPFLKFSSYMKKDFLLFTKRKKYLYLSILLPFLIAGIFLFMLNPSQTNLKVGVCDFDSSELSTKAFSSIENFEIEILDKNNNCLEKIKEKIQKGEIDLGLEIPRGFEKNIQNLKQSRINIYYDNTDVAFSNLISWKVDNLLFPFKRGIVDKLNQELKSNVENINTNLDLLLKFVDLPTNLQTDSVQLQRNLDNLEQLDTEFLINPIWTDKKPIYKQELTKSAGVAFVFPIIAMFITLMLASTSLIYDKKNNFITRVKTSSSTFLYLLAKLLFFVFFTTLQFLIVLLLFIIYGSSFSYNFPAIIHLILFISITNTLIGLIIGLISENEGIAILFSLIISFPLMLISGVFFPTQTLPTIAQYLIKITPLYHQINATKLVLLFNENLNFLWLYISAIVFLVVNWFVRKN